MLSVIQISHETLKLKKIKRIGSVLHKENNYLHPAFSVKKKKEQFD